MKKLFLFLFALIAANVMYADGKFKVGDLYYQMEYWDVYDEQHGYWIGRDSLFCVTHNLEFNENNYKDLPSTVVVPETVTHEGRTYTVEGVGYHAFANCNAITSITLPSTVHTIRYGAFSNCKSLVSVVLPDTMRNIEREACYACSSLSNITLPAGLTKLENNVFEYCSSLTSIVIPEGVKTIGDAALRECRNLASITLPEGLEVIEDRAWEYCKISTITLPSTLDSVGNCTLYWKLS